MPDTPIDLDGCTLPPWSDEIGCNRPGDAHHCELPADDHRTHVCACGAMVYVPPGSVRGAGKETAA